MSKDQDQDPNNRTLGIVFLFLGAVMAVSLGMTLGLAFFATGLPFLVLGIVSMVSKGEQE